MVDSENEQQYLRDTYYKDATAICQRAPATLKDALYAYADAAFIDFDNALRLRSETEAATRKHFANEGATHIGTALMREIEVLAINVQEMLSPATSTSSQGK